MLLRPFWYVSTALPEHVFLLGIHFGAELLGYKYALCLILKNDAKLFSKMIIHVQSAPAIYTSSPCTFTNSSHQLLVLSEFVLLAIWWVCSSCSLWFIFLITKEAKHLSCYWPFGFS